MTVDSSDAIVMHFSIQIVLIFKWDNKYDNKYETIGKESPQRDHWMEESVVWETRSGRPLRAAVFPQRFAQKWYTIDDILLIDH